MSYDFHLFKPQQGIDPSITAEILFQRDLDESNTTVSEIEWRTKQAIVSALVNKNPKLEVFPPELANISSTDNIHAEEQYEIIELNDLDEDRGIQIMVFDQEISVSVAYWHTDEKAKAVFREIWSYLEIIQHVGGCLTYDPQFGRILNLSLDFNDAVSIYTNTVKQFKDVLDE